MKTILASLLLICTLLPAFAYVNDEQVGDLQPYLTSHFSAWLKDNGYGNFGFERTDIHGGSYGGKSGDNDTVTKEPVIFFHGNSDHAILDSGDFYHFNGWTDTITYLLSQGYKESELYVTTWGPADPSQAYNQYHSYNYLNYLRNFVEAVLKYTGAKKIDIIAHSMGVTLARKVIKGGSGTDTSSYDLGKSLADKVDTFLGIAGANYGLVNCQYTTMLKTCDQTNGFYPGTSASSGPSTYLAALNSDTSKLADHVFTMLSTADDLILYNDQVFGRYTSQFPGEDDCKIYNNLGHMALKTSTSQEQLQIITEHKI